ncbi:uncharacterized protein LOC128991891 [Macrosteles quadrilineatus]|uniref:uncharacterized protein LOC128991891 n=1 Tax=Macrosteles quadrilineatus TaxID=74068 RepID=UPI0023E19BA2|nr:uncharacterized protein LOC128991891 [Macrosteles quadrilineatus]
MKIFHRILGMSVLVSVLADAGAELQEETIVWPQDSNNPGRGTTSWKIQTGVLESEADLNERHATYDRKILAILIASESKLENPDYIMGMKVKAATEFASHNVENGVFLTLRTEALPKGSPTKNDRLLEDLWFDWKDKVQLVIVSDKADHEMRSSKYKGKEIYTLIHDFEPECTKTWKGVTDSCLEMYKRSTTLLIEQRSQRQYVWNVMLIVHVDDLGEDYLKGLCPNRREPHHYPMVYHDKFGATQVEDVIGGYSNGGPEDPIIWPCHVQE